jgi:hypothetical protein
MAAGCADPDVVVVNSRAERIEADGKLSGIVFVSQVETRTPEGMPLVYGVRLFDCNNRPITSTDGTYEFSKGQVGARNSIMVVTSPQMFRQVSVAIPVDELHLRPNHLPAVAEIVIWDHYGRSLATRRCEIPITDTAETSPPLAQQSYIDPTKFWFVRGVGEWPSSLWGPFISEEAAGSNSWVSPEDVVALEGSLYLWFVPVQSTSKGSTIWMLACPREDQVGDLVDRAKALAMGNDDLEVGLPIMLRLGSVVTTQKIMYIFDIESVDDVAGSDEESSDPSVPPPSVPRP